jgi:hypothetical protein
MANWFDTLSYPQYDVGGRFNILSIPQLFHAAFSKKGQEDVARQADTRDTLANTAQTQAHTGFDIAKLIQGSPASERLATFRQPAAANALTEAQTSNLGGVGQAQDIANRRAGLDLGTAERSRDEAMKTKALYDLNYPGNTPEFTQYQQGQEQYAHQKRLMDLSAPEEQAAAQAGVLTPEGQFSKTLALHEKGQEQTGTFQSGELKQRQQASLLAGLAHAYANSYDEHKGPLGAALMNELRRQGVPVDSGSTGPSPAAAIDSMVRPGRGQTPPAKIATSVERTPTSASPAHPRPNVSGQKFTPSAIKEAMARMQAQQAKQASEKGLEDYIRQITEGGQTGNTNFSPYQTDLSLEEVRRITKKLQGGQP